MNYPFKTFVTLAFANLFSYGFAQNETTKWIFGNQAGVNFSTNPPTAIYTSTMNTMEGCASVANAAGSLLFYTDGISVWNQNNVVMGNGTNMGGNTSTSQSGLIVKQPGNANIYYIFSLNTMGISDLRYSTVDMNLAAGFGSVTVNGTFLSTGNTEKLIAVKHCNNTDVWVLNRPTGQGNLAAYLVTSAGVNTVPVMSSMPTLTANANLGIMKASPNGRKLAFANTFSDSFDMCDFDNATGIASNPFSLGNTFYWPIGVEFSPDGTKLYGTKLYGPNLSVSYGLYQWDLCAGSTTAIAASQYSFVPPTQVMALQLAIDGKIYIAKPSVSNLAVIQNPNNLGAAMNYSHTANFNFAPRLCNIGLPNFMGSWFNVPPSIGSTTTTSVGCNTYTFNSSVSSYVQNSCSAVAYNSLLWNFGDPSSGSANTSTLASPTHTYLSTGTYSVTLILYSNCSVDTVKKIISVTAPNLSVSDTRSVCAGQSVSLSADGADTYSWSNGASGASVNLSPSVTTIYTVTGTSSLTGCSAQASATVTVQTLPVLSVSGTTLLCEGDTAILNVSGAMSYSWNTGTSGPSVTVTPIFSVIYLINGVDSYGCQSSTTVSVQVISCAPTGTFTGISELRDAEELIVSPNPFSDQLNVKLPQPGELFLFDPYGKLTRYLKAGMGNSTIETKDAPGGMYLLLIRYEDKAYTIKVVKLD